MPDRSLRSAGPRACRQVWHPDEHLSAGLAILLATLLVLMIVPAGFDYRNLGTAAPPAAGDPLSRLLWLALASASLLVVAWRAALARLLLRDLNPFLPAFAVLAMLSLAWSIDPALTIRRLVRMGTMLATCAAFVLAGWHAMRFQTVVRTVLTALLAGSLLFGLAFPELAIHQERSSEVLGAWRGLASHKNGLGDLACIGLILWLHAWLAGEAGRHAVVAGILVAATCLYLSRSSTALAATAVSLVFLLLALRLPLRLRPWLPGLVIALALVLLVYALAILDLVPGSQWLIAPIAALTGKTATFTGRTMIWAILADHIDLHPWLGSGYGAYWTAGPVRGTDAYEFMARMASFFPGSAHNGYLDVINDLGGAGLLCLLAYLLAHVRRSLQLLRLERTQAVLYLALFFQQVIANLSETHWFSVLSVDFVLMTLVSMALARSLVEIRLRAVFGLPAATLAQLGAAGPAGTVALAAGASPPLPA